MAISCAADSGLDLIALYAAVLSTAIAVWEYIKWRNRHSLKVICNANMIFLPSSDTRKYVAVNATNMGDTPTTITHLALYYWREGRSRFFKRERKSFIVPTNQVPKVVSPGEQWMAQFEQTPEIEKMAKEGSLYVVVIHSLGKKEILSRITIAKD